MRPPTTNKDLKMGFKITPRNIASVALAPITGGASLAFAKDSQGYSGLDYVTGAKSAREMEQRQKAYQDETNQLSIDLANSAHQREVNDLKMAGLNPVLSAGGSGSATPQLGTSVAQNEMPGGLMGQATQAANILGTVATAKQATSAAQLQNAQASAIPSQVKLNQAESAKNLAEAGYKQKEIDYYMEHGTFPGQTESDTWSGLGFSRTKTRPAGTQANSAKSAEEKMQNAEDELKDILGIKHRK